MVSLAVSAALTALMTFLHGIFPVLEVSLVVLDFVLSIILVSALFAAMYKVLPDTPIAWHDVIVGAICATLLFAGGKYLIALYIGQSNIASSFGAAGALIVLLLWIFYSAQIFLLGAEFTRAFYADPVRRYMLPVFSDRRADWPSHPHATRDSLHEHDMWVAEGLTHRYPTKVLAELLPTCPQYCGHCTRMDLVGNSTPMVEKLKLTGKPGDRYAAMLAYLQQTPQVRDVVVSGGDVANMPWKNLEGFLDKLRDILD